MVSSEEDKFAVAAENFRAAFAKRFAGWLEAFDKVQGENVHPRDFHMNDEPRQQMEALWHQLQYRPGMMVSREEFELRFVWEQLAEARTALQWAGLLEEGQS